jgi:hypothetical protein
MPATIVSVTFDIDAQSHKNGQFSVPRRVCDILGLRNRDHIDLVIRSSAGTLETTKRLSSGTEIYGSEIAGHVKAGERIQVTASRPK